MIYMLIPIWLLGAFVVYVLDGWFDYKVYDDNSFDLTKSTELTLFCLVWPVSLIIYGLPILASKAHDFLKKKKYNHDTNRMIRIEQLKDLEKIQEDLSEEIKLNSRGL